MIDLQKLVDPYERRARLYPGLICISPLVMTGVVLCPDACNKLSALVAILVSIGVLQLVSGLARDRGKKIEKMLFESWGGMPSVSIFRFSDQVLNQAMKVRYHNELSQKTGIQGPTAEAEQEDLMAADMIYLSWSDYLRSTARDSGRYGLLLEENTNYGFRRNLLGVKPFFLIALVVALGGVSVDTYLKGSTVVFEVERVVVFFVELLLLWVAVGVINRDWVKVPAVEYAKRLLETLER